MQFVFAPVYVLYNYIYKFICHTYGYDRMLDTKVLKKSAHMTPVSIREELCKNRFPRMRSFRNTPENEVLYERHSSEQRLIKVDIKSHVIWGEARGHLSHSNSSTICRTISKWEGEFRCSTCLGGTFALKHFVLSTQSQNVLPWEELQLSRHHSDIIFKKSSMCVNRQSAPFGQNNPLDHSVRRSTSTAFFTVLQ